MIPQVLDLGSLLYEGKAKKVFRSLSDETAVWIEFKDSLTAFNAEKKGSFEGKGSLNAEITSLLFSYLGRRGVLNHFQELKEKCFMKVDQVQVIPLEVVVRNRIAGSLAKKMNLPEGSLLKRPLVEYYYKDDALGDPFVSEDQILALNLTGFSDLETLKVRALEVNVWLKDLFSRVGFILVDFKLEFGLNHKGELLLVDEITPDGCRLWDQKTLEKFDKDRFRRDLGKVKEAYIEVLNRLKGEGL